MRTGALQKWVPMIPVEPSPDLSGARKESGSPFVWHFFNAFNMFFEANICFCFYVKHVKVLALAVVFTLASFSLSGCG